MSDLSLFVDAITTGTILDAGVDSTPEQVRDLLGPGAVEERSGRRLRLDYGLVEFYFDGETREALQCYGATLQLHRLTHAEHDEIVPQPLRQRYGVLPRFVRETELVAAVTTSSGRQPQILRWPAGYVTTQFVGTTAYIHVVDDRARVRNGEPGHGDVWSIELRRRGAGHPHGV